MPRGLSSAEGLLTSWASIGQSDTAPVAGHCLGTGALGGCGFSSSPQGPILTAMLRRDLPTTRPNTAGSDSLSALRGGRGRGRKRDERALCELAGAPLSVPKAMPSTVMLKLGNTRQRLDGGSLFLDLYGTEPWLMCFWSHHLPLSCTTTQRTGNKRLRLLFKNAQQF